MNNYSNANSSGCTSEQRKQNVVDTVGKFKSNYAEARLHLWTLETCSAD